MRASKAAKAKRGRVVVMAWGYTRQFNPRDRATVCVNATRRLAVLSRDRVLEMGCMASPIVPITLPLPAPGKK